MIGDIGDLAFPTDFLALSPTDALRFYILSTNTALFNQMLRTESFGPWKIFRVTEI